MHHVARSNRIMCRLSTWSSEILGSDSEPEAVREENIVLPISRRSPLAALPRQPKLSEIERGTADRIAPEFHPLARPLT